MVRYSGFDASNNATVGDFIASLIFRLCISIVASLGIIFIPVYDIKCLLLLFYLIYISFNIIPIAKSFKKIFWDFFVKEDKEAHSNTCYFRMAFQTFETIINYIAIYFLFTTVLF